MSTYTIYDPPIPDGYTLLQVIAFGNTNIAKYEQGSLKQKYPKFKVLRRDGYIYIYKPLLKFIGFIR